MGFGVSFIGGLADQANRDYAQNSQNAQDQVAQASNWFDTQIMPAYRKQQQAAADITDRYNRYMAINGVDPNVAKRAATDVGNNYSDIDLLNMSKATQQQNSQQPQSQASQQGQQGAPQAPTPSTLPGGTTAPPPPPPAIPGEAAQAAGTGGAPQGAVVPQGSSSPQGATMPQGSPTPTQQPQQQGAMPQQGPQPVQGQLQAANPQQQNDPRGIMNQIGDLLMGRIGNDQIRNQFLQQASQKYGVDKGQIMELINQVNNPQAKPVAPQGSVAAVPTQEQGLKAASQFDNPDAIKAALSGDFAGATKLQQDSDNQDWEDEKTRGLQDQESLARFRGELQAEGNATSLTPDAIHDQALYSLYTGSLPNFGIGKAAAGIKSQFINAQTDVRKELGMTPEDVMAMRSAVKAGQGGVNQLAKTYMSTEAYAQTTLDNMQNALNLAQKGVGPTGTPLIDKWVQSGRFATGDADAKAFNAALETAVTEYGKVMSGGYGAQGLTDAASARAHSLLSNADNIDSLKSVFQVMKTDMDNRRRDYAKQISIGQAYVASGGRSGFGDTPNATPQGQAPQQNTMPTVTNQNDYNNVPAGSRYTDPNGIVRIKPQGQ